MTQNKLQSLRSQQLPLQKYTYLQQIAYIGGFFDGEGCVQVGKNGSIQLRIINTNRVILDYIRSIFGGSVAPRTQKVNKPQYSWSIYGDEAIRFACAIHDFTIEKYSQLTTLIKYQQQRSKLEVIRIKNKKGAFSNPKRKELVEEYRRLLTEQKQQYE